VAQFVLLRRFRNKTADPSRVVCSDLVKVILWDPHIKVSVLSLRKSTNFQTILNLGLLAEHVGELTLCKISWSIKTTLQHLKKFLDLRIRRVNFIKFNI